MTRRQKRIAVILGELAVLGIALGLVLYALRDSIVFFYTPSEMAEKNVAPGQRLRVGGLVEKGSWKKGEGTVSSFVVTDTIKSVTVTYNGQLPDLFREGQGAVVEGVLDASGTFVADTVLAKHDEKYMPKDLADKLKEKGVWKDGQGS
ncbi:MAG: cytochrome c maturation protein CcmE [Rhizobiales bacterium]|nr:cytochrome c maturation protein CcmE [Hyphomicrobiales bacterium]MBI3674681.1 cytochrome c maturation protein CcmE [Hyphomicrobiales bacterium]